MVKDDGAPLTIGDVKAHIRIELARRNLEETHENIFAQGRDAAVPHNTGDPAMPLRLGETIIFDIFPRDRTSGYFHDITRTFFLGHAPDDLMLRWRQIKTIFDSIVHDLRIGERCSHYQDMACDFFEDLGYATVRSNPRTLAGYTHSLGHGLGLDIHESPALSAMPGNDTVLQPGHVISVEPALYDPDKGWGIRIEDTIAVDESGRMINLSNYPYDPIIPVASFLGTGVLSNGLMATTSRPALGSAARIRRSVAGSFSRRSALLVLSCLAVTIAGYLIWQYQQSAITVTVEVNGVAQTIRTHQQHGRQLLRGVGYDLKPEDQVTMPGTLQNGASISLRRARPVILYEGLGHAGGTQQIWSQANTMEGLLGEAGIHLGYKDQVWLDGAPVSAGSDLPAVVWTPPADGFPHRAWEYVATPLHLAVQRAIPATLLDGETAPARFFTTAATIGAALEAAEVPIYEGDSVFPPLDARLQPGQRIVIRRSTPIEITLDGLTLATRTRKNSVGDALAEQGLFVMGLDQVTPALDTPIEAHSAIRITRVNEQVLYEEQTLPFDTVWVADDNLPIDTRQVKQAGAQGILRRRYRVRYENGEEVGRELEDTWVAVAPETRTIAYGRKIAPRTLETPDGVITYWRKIRVYATSYSPRRSGTPSTAAWYGRTRLGMQLEKGVVAVDPSVINMQQRMYVPGYGTGIAGDTGGGVIGKWVDLGYGDADYRSWHWWTDVYLLWPPPASYAIKYVLPNWPRFPDNNP